jgi:hypothetical protein
MFGEDSPNFELYAISRYINGWKALRPGNENLVIFAAITGVPVDLVDPDHLNKVDFTDDTARNAWYNVILNDPRMQEMVDPSTLAIQGAGNLLPSCNFNNGLHMARAYPPRRIVKVAQGYGANGIVQSICQQDFGPALDAIIAIIAKQLGAVCLPRPLVRNRTGLVGCNVVWELPKPNTAPPTTPTACGQMGWEFLLPVGTDRASVSTTGGAVCNVAQLAVLPDATGKKAYQPTMQSNGQVYNSGWYYDDFSPDRLKECTGKDDTNKQRIAFTNGGKPPTGVTVKLECLNEAQSLANTRTDINTAYKQPSVGDACDEATINGQMVHGDAACQIQLIHPSAKWKDGIDRSLFCHPDLNVCVLSCNTNADCPPAWVCDTRADTVKTAGKPLCVNPTCGDLK